MSHSIASICSKAPLFSLGAASQGNLLASSVNKVALRAFSYLAISLCTVPNSLPIALTLLTGLFITSCFIAIQQQRFIKYNSYPIPVNVVPYNPWPANVMISSSPHFPPLNNRHFPIYKMPYPIQPRRDIVGERSFQMPQPVRQDRVGERSHF